MYKLLNIEQKFDTKKKIVTSLENDFYKKDFENPFSQIGISHNELLSLTLPTIRKNREYKVCKNNFISVAESYFRQNSYWNKFSIRILDGIIPICFPIDGDWNSFPFGGGSIFMNNSGNFDIDNTTLPLFSEVYNFMNKSINNRDITKENELVELLEEINNIEKQVWKNEGVDKFDKNISFIALSVFENSVLFWNDYENKNKIFEKAGPGGPGRIASSDGKGAVVGAVVGTITGGPGAGTVVGSWLSSTASSYLQFGIELFW